MVDAFTYQNIQVAGLLNGKSVGINYVIIISTIGSYWYIKNTCGTVVEYNA